MLVAMVSKPLSEMSEEEIVNEITALRDRRAQARMRQATQASVGEKRDKGPKIEEIGGALGEKLGSIFGDDE
jgi:hypothetical protein